MPYKAHLVNEEALLKAFLRSLEVGYCTPNALASLFGVSSSVIRRHLKSKVIDHVEFSGRIRISIETMLQLCIKGFPEEVRTSWSFHENKLITHDPINTEPSKWAEIERQLKFKEVDWYYALDYAQYLAKTYIQNKIESERD